MYQKCTLLKPINIRYDNRTRMTKQDYSVTLQPIYKIERNGGELSCMKC